MSNTQHNYFLINNGPINPVFFKVLPTITNIVCVHEAPALHKLNQCNVKREKLFPKKTNAKTQAEPSKLMNVVNFAIFF